MEMLDFLSISNWFQFPLGVWSALIFLQHAFFNAAFCLVWPLQLVYEDCVSPSSSYSPLPFFICELYGRNTIESFRKQGYGYLLFWGNRFFLLFVPWSLPLLGSNLFSRPHLIFLQSPKWTQNLWPWSVNRFWFRFEFELIVNSWLSWMFP